MKLIKTEKQSEIELNFFYQAIRIYLKKTQVVNRKLSCSSNIAFLKLNLLSCDKNEVKNLIENLENSHENIEDLLTKLGIKFVESDIDKLNGEEHGIFISIDRMTPRSLQKFATCLNFTIIGEILEIVNELLEIKDLFRHPRYFRNVPCHQQHQ